MADWSGMTGDIKGVPVAWQVTPYMWIFHDFINVVCPELNEARRTESHVNIFKLFFRVPFMFHKLKYVLKNLCLF